MNMNIISKVMYKYPRTKYLGYFCNVKTELIKYIESLNLEIIDDTTIMQKYVSDMEKKWFNDRNVYITCTSADCGLTKFGADFLRGIEVSEQGSEVFLNFATSNIVCDVYQSFGRGSYIDFKNVSLASGTLICVRNFINSYGNERYSIAFRVSDSYSIALAITSDETGIKGGARVTVFELTKDSLFIDDAAKYIDVSKMLYAISI